MGRCPGQGQHTWVCEAAGVWQPGGRLMVVLGEHSAAVPVVAAVSLAHEVGHVTGWSGRLLAGVQGMWRAGGCGWAAAGLAGAAWGWPGVLAAAACFQVMCVLALWAGEAGCDLKAARAEGRAATLAAFGYITVRQAASRATTPRWRTAIGAALRWAAGPSHPPVWLRAAVVRVTTTP